MLPVPQRRLCRERRHPRRGGAAHAPVIFQEAGDPIRDLYAAFDFDGDWNGDNNAENMECWSEASKCNTPDNPFSTCAGQRCPLIATVYRTVIETPTHWFIQYLPYHPRDWKLTNGHEHDTESLLMVVARAGGGFGRLQILETRFHLDWFRYAAGPAVAAGQGSIDGPVHTDAASGRPAVDSQLAGHGLCGGFAPPNFLFPDLQLTCDHAGQPHLVGTGVIYSPDTVPIEMPMVVDGRAVPAGYRLVELLTSIWPHRFEIGRGKAFLSAWIIKASAATGFNARNSSAGVGKAMREALRRSRGGSPAGRG